MKYSAFIIGLFLTFNCLSKQPCLLIAGITSHSILFLLLANNCFGRTCGFRQPNHFLTFSKVTVALALGNFYSNSEPGSLCPAGWHGATIADWENYIQAILQIYNINGGVLQYDSLLHKEEKISTFAFLSIKRI